MAGEPGVNGEARRRNRGDRRDADRADIGDDRDSQSAEYGLIGAPARA